jgi:L-arabinonolactonase
MAISAGLAFLCFFGYKKILASANAFNILPPTNFTSPKNGGRGGSMSELSRVLDAKAQIAESPVWYPESNSLYWTEIHGFRLHRLNVETGEDQAWTVKEKVSSFAICNENLLVAALHSGFALINLKDGTLARIAQPLDPELHVHMNDGRCDRSGRFFWAGSLHHPRTMKNGALFRLSADGECRQMADGVIASNGVAFSPDNRILYYADSRGPHIWAFDHDPVTSELSNRRIFAALEPGKGLPDGAAVDSEGCYWTALFMGRRIVRYRPDGEIDRVIDVPFDNPTMVAFGGPDYRTLYITSGRGNLSPEQLASQPLAGGIFRMAVDVPGLPEPRFKPSAKLLALPTESLA